MHRHARPVLSASSVVPMQNAICKRLYFDNILTESRITPSCHACRPTVAGRLQYVLEACPAPRAQECVDRDVRTHQRVTAAGAVCC